MAIKYKKGPYLPKDLIYQNVKLYNRINQTTYKSFFAFESSCWRGCKINFWCFAITYNPINNLCNIFSANFSYGFERTQVWKSYTLQELNFTNIIENKNIQLSNYYKKKNIALKENCWLACLSELDSCVAISFNQNICYFFNSGYDVYKEYGSLTITTRDIQLKIL